MTSREKNAPTSNWLINKTIKNTLISLVKCTARFLRAKFPESSVNDTVNTEADVEHSRCDFSPLRTNHNDLRMAFPLSSKRLTLSFGFAVQHVLLSLLGCNIVVQAVEKILLIIYFLVAVTRKNKTRGHVCNSYTLIQAVSINNLLGYKTQTYMLHKKTIKLLKRSLLQAQTFLCEDRILSHVCGRQGWAPLLLLNSQQCLPLYLTHSPALFN